MADLSLIPLGSIAVAVIFQAGGLLYAFRRLKKDADGIGRKVNTMQQDIQKRNQKILTVFLLICTDEEREKIAKMLND